MTLYGMHGSRTIRVGRRIGEALLRLIEGKEPDARIAAITGRARPADLVEEMRSASPRTLRR